MAKVGDIIRFVDDIRPNAYTDGQKLQWLSELEAKIQGLILYTPAGELRVPYVFPGDEETETVVGPPWDKLYWMYLAAMIDYANGEYAQYQNSMVLFNDAYGDYSREHMRRNGYQGPKGALRGVF